MSSIPASESSFAGMPRPTASVRYGADPPEAIVRPAEVSDLGDLASLLAESFYDRTCFDRWLLPLMRLGIYEDLRMRLRSPRTDAVCWVAAATEILGTVELTLRSPPFWQPLSSPYLYISNLAVRRQSRRRGTACQLLAQCEKRAIEWGYSDLYLHVLENNQQARRLYEKFGYRLVRVESSWLTVLMGKPRKLLLHKRLRIARNPQSHGGVAF